MTVHPVTNLGWPRHTTLPRSFVAQDLLVFRDYSAMNLVTGRTPAIRRSAHPMCACVNVFHTSKDVNSHIGNSY